jgi:glycosyltransferase involved in cell wall biosynthesis
MHVMHVMASFSRSGAGVYEAVLGATRAFIKSGGGRVTVVAASDQVEHAVQDRQIWEEAGAELVEVPRSHLRFGVAGDRLINRAGVRSVDIVQGHGLWCGTSLTAAAMARRLDRPLVVSPHGMLEPWARRHHRQRKQLAWAMAERAALSRADLLQAMSEREVDSLRAAGLFQPVVVHPVGIEIPAQLPACDEEGAQHAGGSGNEEPIPRTCLFLSRLHPIKGLAMLLEAWAQLRPAGWRLVVAGPDHHGHAAAMERMARRMGVAERVAFVAPAYGSAKWRLLADADLFVLPSHSENFGVVIAEALAMGTPVITTTGTPWSMLRDHGAGWWVPPDPASLADALRQATLLPPDALLEMGARGRDLARERFVWPAITATVGEAYRWLLDGGAAPSAMRCVESHSP